MAASAGDDTGDSRAGRRGNGLPAAAYSALAQCEPQVATALLDTLAREGIAAYTVPYEGSIGGYLEVHPPVRPLVRVWVDSGALDAARELLRARHPSPAEPPAVAEADAWAEIVAALRRPGPQGPAPWPDAENLPATRTAGSDSSTEGRRSPVGGAPTSPAVPGGRTGPAARAEAEPADEADTADDEAEDGFVPPPPPPVPVPTGPSAYAIAALIGGFVVLLASTMAGDQISPTLLVLAIAAIVGGFATLVARMRAGPPTDSSSDDGAVL